MDDFVFTLEDEEDNVDQSSSDSEHFEGEFEFDGSAAKAPVTPAPPTALQKRVENLIEGGVQLSSIESEEESEDNNSGTEESEPVESNKKKKSKRIVADVAPLKSQRARDFSELKLSRPLIRAIKDLGWVTPTPVQAETIPLALTGCDLLVNAVTGSGKTAAFVLPVLERLLFRSRRISATRVLVLTPTRELAAQCYNMTKQLCKFTDVTAALVAGGLSLQAQEVALRSRPDIVIATPGRLIDHLRNSKSVHMEETEILILDEADRLLELGFQDEVKEIVKSCPRGRQSLLFSATLTEEVEDLVNLSLNRPQRVSVDPLLSIVDNLTQEFIRIRKDMESTRLAIVLALCKRSFKSQTIVFIKSKALAHRCAIIFTLAGLKVAELHGNLTQLQRLDALDRFRKQEVDFLLCTDLASRGLDIEGVQTVINMSLPREFRQYVHRVGRTARAGRAGRAVSLVGEDQRKLLKEIMKKAKDVVKSRTIAPEILAKYTQFISQNQTNVDAVLRDERLEKEARIAEMEANKAQNLMIHHDSIMSRPARTWFQSPQEKILAKEKNILVSGDKKEKKTEETQPKEKKSEKKKSEKKTMEEQLRGLPRAKRRRKQMKLEEEKEKQREERQKEKEEKEEKQGKKGSKSKKDQKTKKKPAKDLDNQELAEKTKALGRQAKAKRRKTEKKSLKKEKEPEEDSEPKKKKRKTPSNEFDLEKQLRTPKSQKKKIKALKIANRYADGSAVKDKRFQLGKKTKQQQEKEDSAAKHPTKVSRKGFKTKGRYKRRKK